MIDVMFKIVKFKKVGNLNTPEVEQLQQNRYILDKFSY